MTISFLFSSGHLEKMIVGAEDLFAKPSTYKAREASINTPAATSNAAHVERSNRSGRNGLNRRAETTNAHIHGWRRRSENK